MWQNFLSVGAMGFFCCACGIATETGGVMTVFAGGLSWTEWLSGVGGLAARTLPGRWKHSSQTNFGRCDMNYKINAIFGLNHLDNYLLILWAVHLYWSVRIKIGTILPQGRNLVYLASGMKTWDGVGSIFPGILYLYFQLLNWHWFFFCFLTNSNSKSLITCLQIKMNQQGLGNRFV